MLCALAANEGRVYHLLSTREAYDESVFHKCEEEAFGIVFPRCVALAAADCHPFGGGCAWDLMNELFANCT